MLLPLLLLSSISPGQVDLVLGPTVQAATVGSTVEITLTATAPSPPTVESFTAIDAILSWDPTKLAFIEADASGYPWFVAGFLGDPDGINTSITDGEALYTMLAPPGAPASIPPNIDAVIFRFTVLESAIVSLKPTSGTFGKTRVLGTGINRDITGDISATATVIVPSVNYCTAGTSFNGCMALLSSTGIASESATSGFTVLGSTMEGAKNGTFYFGLNGRQANPWGSGTSLQCVVPPVIRTGLQTAAGTQGLCNGVMSIDLNALWCAGCPKPLKNPGAGTEVQLQLWYRDPFNTSNQTTSLSNGLEFTVGP
jgi:hypothetical protein